MNKLCMDCKHWIDEGSGLSDKCSAGAVESVSLVRGQMHNSSCYLMRMQHGNCGPEAKLFEGRES